MTGIFSRWHGIDSEWDGIDGFDKKMLTVLIGRGYCVDFWGKKT